jgi:peptidoglycan/xylan/chitin deacetylase (PgdA/CDA1 family)
MWRYRIILGIFFFSVAAVIISPLSLSLKALLLGVVSLFLLALLAYGAASIGSQFFVRSICRGNRADGVALTFDDGPHPEMTPAIMEILERYSCKGTFFLTGSKIAGNEMIVESLFRAGHTIGNHSFSHSNLFPLFKRHRIEEEIRDTNCLIERVTGTPVLYFRPPFGVTNPTIARALGGMKMKVTGWSIRSFDTLNVAPLKVVKRIMRKVGGGDIILLHDTSRNILEVMEALIPEIRKRGLHCVTLQQLLEDQ